MKISFRFIPAILFFVFFGLLQFSFSHLRKIDEKKSRQETQAIFEIVTDRFKRYLELPFTVGALGASYLAPDYMNIKYEHFAQLVQDANPEFLAFNIVDASGAIVRVFPQDKANNQKVQGRRSQNLGPLLESFEKNEPYYLSPPLRLYQGEQGFIFYVPMLKGKQLLGWYAVVISSESFLKKFALEDFLRVFELVIADEATGHEYFATSLGPRDDHTKVYSKSMELFGRKMFFKTWRKEENPIHSFPWYFSVFLSLILAGAIELMFRLYEQRKKVRSQLDNMGILLRVTSKEALSNLIEIHSEFNQLNLPEDEKVDRLSRDINYLTNLIEQIDLLQTMAHTREGLTEGEHTFLPILKEQLENFDDVFEKKNVQTVFNEADFKGLTLRVNEWLFGNSVLCNVISHLLIHVVQGSPLEIENRSNTHRVAISFRVKRQPSTDHSSKLVTRRIEVAKKVLQLQQGELREMTVGQDELEVTIYLPK